VTRIIALALTAITTLALTASPALAKTPKPKLGHTVVVMATDGHPTVKSPHKKRKKLKRGKAIAVPVGSTIDATSGHVKLTSAKQYGGTQSGKFSQGAFVVSQSKSNDLTDLQLTGGSSGACSAGAGRKPVTAAATRRRRLFGSAHGHFRTRGRSSSATVRGTEWLTEDSCAGTTAVKNMSPNTTSKVATTTNDIQFDLDPGQTATGYCNQFFIAPDTYCTVLLAEPENGLIGGGIITQVDQDNYDLCIVAPDNSSACDNFALSTRSAEGWRQAIFACAVNVAGTYYFGWSLDHENLLAPGVLSLTIDKPAATLQCSSNNDPPSPGTKRLPKL
jgi:hypothetical protein